MWRGTEPRIGANSGVDDLSESVSFGESSYWVQKLKLKVIRSRTEFKGFQWYSAGSSSNLSGNEQF